MPKKQKSVQELRFFKCTKTEQSDCIHYDFFSFLKINGIGLMFLRKYRLYILIQSRLVSLRRNFYYLRSEFLFCKLDRLSDVIKPIGSIVLNCKLAHETSTATTKVRTTFPTRRSVIVMRFNFCCPVWRNNIIDAFVRTNAADVFLRQRISFSCVPSS